MKVKAGLIMSITIVAGLVLGKTYKGKKTYARI